ncbi:MAG: DUF4180 domain-containing protein [Hyphomicrobiales bacterium]
MNYRIRLEIIGDVEPYTSTRRAFHDLVYESNRVGQVLFVPGRDALRERLAQLP